MGPACNITLTFASVSAFFLFFLLLGVSVSFRVNERLLWFQPAAALKPLTPSIITSASSSAISEVSECLKHPPSAGGGIACWNAFHRKQYLQVLDALYASPPESLVHFQPSNWQIFDLIIPTYQCESNGLRRVGAEGDGGKWLCGPIDTAKQDKKCTIFSLGSNNQFDFEEAIQRYTNSKCEIHTFDCTGNWSNPHTNFHNWCIGGFDGQDDQGRTFKRLSTVARELSVESITLLKMDIEQSEYSVFESFKQEPESFLPDQILFELHTLTNQPPFSNNKDLNWVQVLIDVIRDIDRLGYSFAFQEKNVACGACSEYVLIRDRSKAS